MFKIKGSTYSYSMIYINNLKSTVPSCFRIYSFRIYISISRLLFMASGLNITPQDCSGTLTHEHWQFYSNVHECEMSSNPPSHSRTTAFYTQTVN